MKAGLDRDRTLDKALRRALGARADVPASDACLDAETLAAWMDEGLDPAAVALAEAHVSSCARCQAVVGVIVRTAPDVPVSGVARSSFWRWWLAPIAASAAAVTLWMVVPGERYVAPPAPPAAELAQAPSTGFANEPPPPESLSALPPPPTPLSPLSPPAIARKPAEDAARRETTADASAAIEKRVEKRVETRVDETASAGADARARPPADAPAPAAPAQSMAFQELSRVIASPDPAVRWRIETAGVVHYTADGARTWERVSTGVTTEIVAGSSPSRDVCWLVGRGGLVLVTSNGRTFARVSTPVVADLTAVQASDASNAVVTAADGRAFLTDDGGLTWRPRD